MAGMELQIITPRGVQLTESVSELTAPSTKGEFGILPGHRPIVASLKTGIVSFIVDGQTQRVAVGPGFVEFRDDKATLLTDQFCRKEDVDPVRVRLELKEADQALDDYSGAQGEPEFVALVARELWAAAQLELYGDPPPPTMATIYEFQGAADVMPRKKQEPDEPS